MCLHSLTSKPPTTSPCNVLLAFLWGLLGHLFLKWALNQVLESRVTGFFLILQMVWCKFSFHPFPLTCPVHDCLMSLVGMMAFLMSVPGFPVHLTQAPQPARAHRASKKLCSVKGRRSVGTKGSSHLLGLRGSLLQLLLLLLLLLPPLPPFSLSCPAFSFFLFSDFSQKQFDENAFGYSFYEGQAFLLPKSFDTILLYMLLLCRSYFPASVRSF